MQAIKRRLLALPNRDEGFQLLKAFEALYNTQCLGSAALAINGASAATWKMGNAAALPYILNGTYLTKTAATAQAVPAACTITAIASTYSATMFTIALDIGGNVLTYASPQQANSTVSAAAALANLISPTVPDGVVVIGHVIIQSTTANTTFTAATTALDAAGIGVTYINVTGPFFPVAPV